MKKLLLLAFFFVTVSLSVLAQSENFNPLKLDFGFGYASPLTKTNGVTAISGGITGTTHLHYLFTDQLSVGLRVETAILAFAVNDQANDYYSDGNFSVLNSYCLSGEYYFSNDSFRPFVGIAAGVFNKTSLGFSNSSDDAYVTGVGENKFGVAPTIGFEIWHFRLAADYNYLPNRAGYLGIKAAFFLGGGRKNGSGGSGADHRSRRVSTWGG